MKIDTKEQLLRWFGHNLRRIRKDKGYTQERIARKAGIDVSYYGAVERGERSITILKMSHITRALDIPMGDLFAGETGRAKNEREERLEQLIVLFRKMDVEDLQLFFDILQKLVQWKNRI